MPRQIAHDATNGNQVLGCSCSRRKKKKKVTLWTQVSEELGRHTRQASQSANAARHALQIDVTQAAHHASAAIRRGAASRGGRRRRRRRRRVRVVAGAAVVASGAGGAVVVGAVAIAAVGVAVARPTVPATRWIGRRAGKVGQGDAKLLCESVQQAAADEGHDDGEEDLVRVALGIAPDFAQKVLQLLVQVRQVAVSRRALVARRGAVVPRGAAVRGAGVGACVATAARGGVAAMGGRGKGVPAVGAHGGGGGGGGMEIGGGGVVVEGWFRDSRVRRAHGAWMLGCGGCG